VDRRLRDIIINAKIGHSEPVFRLAETAEALDAAFALFAGFVMQMTFDCGDNIGSIISPEPPDIADGLGRKDYLVHNSGQNMARIGDSSRNCIPEPSPARSPLSHARDPSTRKAAPVSDTLGK
jgi:hypothetical protein